MAIKQYMLLDHMKPTAPISVQVSKDQRVKLDVLPLWRPYLQITFQDGNDKKNKTIRLKLNSNTPYQDEQIEKEKIPANEPFTNAERDAAKFHYGVCTTDNEVVQKYLEAYPAFEGFKGYCNEIRQPVYRLFDEGKVVDDENNDFMRRLDAANKIRSLDLKGAQDLLIRVFGVTYVPPTTLKLAQNVLVKFMDDFPDEGIDEILKETINLDEETVILTGRLITAGILSFDAMAGQVAKKGKDGKWIAVKAISNDYTPAERQRYFLEYLTSEEGKLLLEDLKTDLAKKQEAGNKKQVSSK